MFRRVPKAGGYAQERYERGLRNWRSWLRRVMTLLLGPFIVAGVLVLIIEGHGLSWFAGGITGGLSALWLTMRDSPPGYVENWGLGADGERRTEKELRPLERAGWELIHDIQARYGNYDHVAVSQAGVFLLESKNPRGIVTIRDGTPRLVRRLYPGSDERLHDIRSRTLSAARRLNEDIARQTGRSPWVQAVVVLWADFPEGVFEDERCVFIHGSQLRAWLQRRPRRLGQANAEQVAAAIVAIAGRDPNETAASHRQLQTA